MIYLQSVIGILNIDKNKIQEISKLKSDKEILISLMGEGLSKDSIIEEFEKFYAIDYYNLSNLDRTNLLPVSKEDEKELKKENILLVEGDNDEVFVVNGEVFNNSSKLKIAERIVGNKKLLNAFSFNFEIEDYYNNTEGSKKANINSIDFSSSEEAIELNELNTNVSQFVQGCINHGIKIGASDIHIEPTETGLQIRYRVDGDLVSKKSYIGEEEFLNKIISLIKVISNLDLSERRKPQDGKITDFDYEGDLYEIRVSTVALVLGEKIVFRITKKEMDFLGFGDLGFSEKAEADTKRFLNKQNGIIFLGGATGSGKTTTLYTMINYLNDDTKNIYTVEDPVEKKVDNVNQIEIQEKGGITYPNTLRALLRQDPDIIVVGEIRDLETAELAANGSLTGHLMLSTVHANNAIATITRLLDMGLEPFLLGSTAIAFYSQRLVKRLCPHCKKPKTELTETERVWLKKVEEKYNLCYNEDDILSQGIYEEVGCEMCFDGNKGRTALVEYVEIDDHLKNAILNNANEKDILEHALDNGFKPFVYHGINKVLEGELSIQKVIEEEFI